MEIDYGIDNTAEFRDKKLEQQYFESEGREAINYYRYVIVFFGAIYFLLLFGDYFALQSQPPTVFYLTIVLRLFVLLAAINVYLFANKFKSYKSVNYLITFFEVATVISYFSILYLIYSQNFLGQCIEVIVLTLAIFMIPNQWRNLMGLSIFCVLYYLLLALSSVGSMSSLLILEAFLFISIVTVFSAISAFKLQHYKRKQYANQVQLQKLTVTDKLTHINNRMKFDSVMEEWCNLASRYKYTFSLIMFDLDNFKNINDTYGHMEGDNVIIGCCKLVSKSIRSADVFARWGGEEFTILLPQTRLNEGYELAERLRIGISNLTFENARSVTCSFGVSEYKPGDTPESLIMRVDDLMYQAKRSGKNTVVNG